MHSISTSVRGGEEDNPESGLLDEVDVFILGIEGGDDKGLFDQ